MATADESTWKYVRYVTLSDAWKELWGGILAWVVITAVFMILAVTFEFGVSATESWWSGIPKPVLYFIAFAVFTWFTRGESLSLSMPKSVKGWLGLNAFVLLVMVAASVLGGWAFIPFYTGVVFAGVFIDSLSAIGRRNYERLSENTGSGA